MYYTYSELRARARAQLGNQIFSTNWMLALVVTLIANALIGAVAATFVGALLVTGPLLFGVAMMFLKQTRDGEPMNLGAVFDGFRCDFAQSLLIWLMSTIFSFLWGLLFIIPGIVKQYAYSMAYFVKADHPEYDWSQCLAESQRLMRGRKGDLFLLDLSFIGWYILGALCFGVGVLWVNVYAQATRAQFYQAIIQEPQVDY